MEKGKVWRLAGWLVWFFLVLTLVGVLAGCASVEQQAGRAVHNYCGATTDADQAAIRGRLDAETDPHTLRVNCARESGGEHAEKN